MLNYLSAELWKAARRRRDRVGWTVFFLLVAFMGFTWNSWGTEGPVEVLEDVMVVGLLLGMPLASAVSGGLWEYGLLGNELSAGWARSRIYLGKLMATLLWGVALYAATVAVYLLSANTAWLLAEQSFPNWDGMWELLFQSLPRYLGAAALGQCLIFLVPTGALAAVLYYLYLFFGEMLLSTLWFSSLGVAGEMLNALISALRPFLITRPYFVYAGVMPDGLWESWLTGTVWLCATTALGIGVFSKREIK